MPDGFATWSPDSPNLYSTNIKLLSIDDTVVVDEAASYFGMAKLTVTTVDVPNYSSGSSSVPLLNGKAIFQMGTLDQGFWPDGNYAAPTDEALRFDLEAHKAMGFNMVRKHIKMEPRRWSVVP